MPSTPSRDARYRSTSRTTCWRDTAPERSWPCRRTIRATMPSPVISDWKSRPSSQAATSAKSPTTPRRANSSTPVFWTAWRSGRRSERCSTPSSSADWANGWSTTDCATPSSRASVTGENPSRSTIATKSPARCRNRRCRSNCRPSATSAPPKRANRRWPAQRGGRRPTAIRSNCRRCPGSQVRPPTTCATWTRTTTARSSAAKRTNTGGRSTSTWAASNMRRAT